MIEAIDFNDFDKNGNGFEDEVRLARVHTAPFCLNPEVHGDCEERDNDFELFCSQIVRKDIRNGVVNLAFELSMSLGLINKFGKWQSRGDALAESKEQVYPIWALSSAWVIDCINASDDAVKATAKKYPTEYRSFWDAMAEKKVFLPAPVIPLKKRLAA